MVTGYNVKKDFVKEKQKKIMVDIDRKELNRSQIKLKYKICCDAKYFLKTLLKYLPKKKEIGAYDDYVIEDNENFIVINKPSGVPVQSGTKSFKNIIDILKNTKYFEDTKPFVVHRLDKETSGVMIVAKNREYAQLFTSLFRIRKMHKTYLAITHGEVKKDVKLLQDSLVTYEKNKK